MYSAIEAEMSKATATATATATKKTPKKTPKRRQRCEFCRNDMSSTPARRYKEFSWCNEECYAKDMERIDAEMRASGHLVNPEDDPDFKRWLIESCEEEHPPREEDNLEREVEMECALIGSCEENSFEREEVKLRTVVLAIKSHRQAMSDQ